MDTKLIELYFRLAAMETLMLKILTDFKTMNFASDDETSQLHDVSSDFAAFISDASDSMRKLRQILENFLSTKVIGTPAKHERSEEVVLSLNICDKNSRTLIHESRDILVPDTCVVNRFLDEFSRQNAMVPATTPSKLDPGQRSPKVDDGGGDQKVEEDDDPTDVGGNDSLDNNLANFQFEEGVVLDAREKVPQPTVKLDEGEIKIEWCDDIVQPEDDYTTLTAQDDYSALPAEVDNFKRDSFVKNEEEDLEEEDKQTERDQQKVECEMCGKFISRINITHHRKTHSGQKPHTCSVCEKGFLRRIDMKKHMLIHGPRQKVTCPTCGKSLMDQKSLEKHIEKGVCHKKKFVGSAGQKKQFKCGLCNTLFRTEDNLKRHKDTFVHDKFACPTCDKRFYHKTYYERHLMKHSSEKTHPCGICGLMFKTEKCVKMHQANVHEENVPVSCDVCGKVVKQKKYLRYHMMVHSTERAFSCELCGQTFRQPHGLQKHKLSHTDERPYSCDVCGKSYREKQTFDKHKNIHNKEAHFKCGVCGRSFSFLSALNRHCQKVHKLDKRPS